MATKDSATVNPVNGRAVAIAPPDFRVAMEGGGRNGEDRTEVLWLGSAGEERRGKERTGAAGSVERRQAWTGMVRTRWESAGS